LEKIIGGISYNVFSEEIVIGELLTDSTQFKSYYESRRKNIKKPVHWALDSSPEPISEASARRHLTGEQIILLRRIPPLLTDAFIVAHELEHLAMDYEGFVNTRSIVSNQDIDELASAFNAMIQHPIVNSRLELFGFDFKKIYEDVSQKSQATFRNLREPSPDRIMKLQWIFMNVDFMLAHNVAYQTWPDKRWVRTMKKSRYPEIGKDVRELTQYILDRGLDTPQKQEKLANKIMAKYHLEDLLVIHKFDSSAYNDS